MGLGRERGREGQGEIVGMAGGGRGPEYKGEIRLEGTLGMGPARELPLKLAGKRFSELPINLAVKLPRRGPRKLPRELHKKLPMTSALQRVRKLPKLNDPRRCPPPPYLPPFRVIAATRKPLGAMGAPGARCPCGWASGWWMASPRCCGGCGKMRCHKL